MRTRASESGNILFYILIAVALFAALSYVVSTMMRGGAELGRERSSLMANEIMDYGQTLRRGIQPLRISNGCEDTDISFEAANLASYVNGANTKCQVFHTDGGGVVYLPPSSDYSAASDWIFTGENIVDGVGSTAPDLIAVLPELSLEVCDAINEKLGVTAVGNDADIDFTPFQGTYAATQTIDFAAGKQAGCLDYANSGDHYFYYQVLISR